MAGAMQKLHDMRNINRYPVMYTRNRFVSAVWYTYSGKISIVAKLTMLFMQKFIVRVHAFIYTIGDKVAALILN